jgi:hypothetical protein
MARMGGGRVVVDFHPSDDAGDKDDYDLQVPPAAFPN